MHNHPGFNSETCTDTELKELLSAALAKELSMAGRPVDMLYE